MPDLQDGESAEVQGSAASPYILKNIGGVYSCSCPAWRNQSLGIERRSCKHLRQFRGDAAEEERIGGSLPARPQTNESKSAAPRLLLAQSWTNDIDLAGWWMSEKLDGVRAYWDGKQFLSRQGNLFHAPDWFLEQMPETPLDGELWLGRKSFQRTVSIVRRQDKSELWRELAYVVFDAPAVSDVFERRLEALQDLLTPRHSQFVRLLEHQRCRNAEHLNDELARIEALGGEGLMLRQPGSRYEAGRSATLLKVKRFHDAEAQVIGHQPGTGRHKGRLGAVRVVLPDGIQFSVGTGFSDAQREDPPLVGSIITFRYQELTDRGVPRFPSFVRVRRDAEESQSPAQEADQKRAVRPPAIRSVKSITTNPTKVNAMSRHFEFRGGNSSKFWGVSVEGHEVTVHYGRIGTQGQTQTKNFSDAAAAQRHTEKLIAAKTKKGYVEVVSP